MCAKDAQMFLKGHMQSDWRRSECTEESSKEAFGDEGQRMAALHQEGGWGKIGGELAGLESYEWGERKAMVSDVCQTSHWGQEHRRMPVMREGADWGAGMRIQITR